MPGVVAVLVVGGRGDLIVAIESEYGIRFRPAEIDEAKWIGQIAGLVSSKRA